MTVVWSMILLCAVFMQRRRTCSDTVFLHAPIVLTEFRVLSRGLLFWLCCSNRTTMAQALQLSATALKGASLVDLPRHFVLTTLNPAARVTKGGFAVVQQHTPFRLSRVAVEMSPTTEARQSAVWIVRTHNVRRFRFSAAAGALATPATLLVDGTHLKVS